MAARIFLGLSALVWLPYGVLCFFLPAGLAESAGVSFTSPTGATELRAMYGGLQAAIGAVALAGAMRPALSRSALGLLFVACAGRILRAARSTAYPLFRPHERAMSS